jgi:acetyl esterase/lipase
VIRGQLRLIGRLWALNPPWELQWKVMRWSWALFAREFAFQFALIAATVIAGLLAIGAANSTIGLVVVGLLAADFLFLSRLAWQSWRSARTIQRELEEVPGEPAKSRFPRTHLAFPILMLFARSVRKRRGVVFHKDGKLRLRLDVYRPRVWSPDDRPRPAVIQVHGGGWIAGSRLEQGIPLLNHMAANGWVGFNVDYRLSPRATLPDHVIDVKRAIAWVREHADELRIDPRRICLTGGSAGGHLCALAALTADDRSLQPGFEEADTSVAAAVPFYGVYDMLDDDAVYYEGIRSWLLEEIVIKRRRGQDPEAFRAVSPTHRVHPGAPPFMVFHGERDTLVPPEDARAFVRRLEAVSESEVLYVELPGAEHAFDLFPSLRTARVVEGIERFLRTVVEAPPDGRPQDRDLALREDIPSPA